MSQVKIAPEIPMADVSLGMTLLCSPSDGKREVLDEIRAQLFKETHDTVFARAFLIAELNNRKLFGRDSTYNEFLKEYDGRDALFLSLPGDTPVCAAICGGNVLAPSAEMSPENKPDQKLFILTAMGIARAESDGESVH